MKYNPKEHGRTSAANPATDALRQEWEMVGQLPEGDGEWVPRSTVFIRDDISPRKGGNVDREKVKEYAGILRQLPPIVVQKGTFVLIDGKHRLAAAFETDASSLHIRIREVDIPDADLRLAAFRENMGHGRPLTTSERIAHLRYLIVERKDQRPDKDLAMDCGLSRSAVIDNRHKWTGRMNVMASSESAGRQSHNSPPPYSDAPEPAKQKPVSTPKAAPVTRTREAIEPEYEEPTRDADDWPEVDPDSEIPGTIEEAPFGILAINDDGTAEGRIVDGDGAPSAVTQGEVEQLPLVAPSPADEWFEAHRRPGHAWLTGLSDAALTYISALETAALTSDEVVAEVEARAEARREARWHRATIAEQDRVTA